MSCTHETRIPLGTLGRSPWSRCRDCGLDIKEATEPNYNRAGTRRALEHHGAVTPGFDYLGTSDAGRVVTIDGTCVALTDREAWLVALAMSCARRAGEKAGRLGLADDG